MEHTTIYKLLKCYRDYVKMCMFWMLQYVREHLKAIINQNTRPDVITYDSISK